MSEGVFTVNASDASVMQQHYEQMIETLLRALLDNKQDKNNEYQGLKIFDGDRLVYGRDQNQFRDEVSGLSGQLLNPQLIVQLQQLRSTPVGGIVEGAANKIVKLDDRIVLQSDEDGRVTVNTLSVQNTVQDTSSQVVKQVRATEVQANDDSSTISGSARVMSSLQSIEDSPLKTLLVGTLQQLQFEREALQKERAFYQNLIETRLQQPQNTSWWQQVKNNVLIAFNSVGTAVSMKIQQFKEDSTKYQGAASLRTLFHLHAQPGAKEYQASGYQISREGSLYEVKSSATGEVLMQFRSTPLGVKIEKENLNPEQIKDIENLRHSLEQNEPIPTSFTSVGQQEAEYLNRVNKIANALVQYATVRQENVQIDGKFSYKWQASPEGKVRISTKDGREVLLKKEADGKLVSSMSEQDLTYFEQVLSNLNLNKSASLSSQKTEKKELSR
ncbi:hypothetical protein [Fischerella thermalis]|uniref:hypothetical protein n=1 Tax=Fischerella thermalis TaxID=372787 RepID=UPI0015E1396C|nr:hypothetical protein [Fischerella thermalis]